MHDPKEEEAYVEWMKEKEAETDKHYEKKMKEILNPEIEVKYFKRDYEKFKNDKSMSTVSKRRKVLGRHTYQWKKRDRKTGKIDVIDMIGKSVKLEGETSRFMPYELRVKEKKKKKQKK